MGVYATRVIAKNEELLLSYGARAVWLWQTVHSLSPNSGTPQGKAIGCIAAYSRAPLPR
jgi:hypothetical protein